MIYIVDNILNYAIYLFISGCGFRLKPRKNKFFIGASVLTMFLAGVWNAYFDINSPLVYIVWSILSISLFFEEHPVRLILLSAGLMYFTGIVDTFSVMLIQIVLIGGGIAGTDIAWWMEPAYLLSFLVYLSVYFLLLKKNEVYLCDIENKYKIAILIQGDIFQMFYHFVFSFYNENSAMYGLNAYITFLVSIAGAVYSIFLTLSLAIKNILSDRQNSALQSLAYMQKQQYDYQLQQSVAVRRFKHDLANHIGVLRELVNQKDTEAVKEYIDTIWDMQGEFDFRIHTGDNFLDVIINYYCYLAEKEKVAFAISGRLTENLPLEMVDVTSLVGNILQNALEAAKKAVVPEIRVELAEHKKEIFLVVNNSVADKAAVKKDFFRTSKADKEHHGFGMKNIAAVVEKYHGEFYIDTVAEQGKAMCKISVAIPKKEQSKQMEIPEENKVCR